MNRIVNITGIMLVETFFLLTLTCVEQTWAQSDSWLILLVTAAMAMVALPLFVYKQEMVLTIADVSVSLLVTIQSVAWHVGYGVFTPSAFITFLETAILYFVFRLLFSVSRISGSLLTWSLLICAIVEVCWGEWQIYCGTSRHDLFPVTGAFLNPGPYSAYVAIGIATAIGLVSDGEEQSASSKIAIMMIVAGMVMLAITWSRAAWISVTIAASVAYREWISKHKTMVTILTMVLLIALYFSKSGSADGRLLLWLVAARAIVQSPLIGHGIGSFPHVYAEGTSNYFSANPDSRLLLSADVADNAFCELLNIGVEQGLVGMLTFTIVMALSVRWLITVCRPLAYALLALVTFSFFSYPFHTMPYRIMLALLCAYSVSVGKGKVLLSLSKWQTLGVVAIALPLCCVLFMQVKYKVTAAAEFKSFRTILPQYAIDDYYKLLPYMDDDPDFLFCFAKGLSALGRYNDSNAVLRKGQAVSADPMSHVVMGNNYKEMGLVEDAEKLYWQAFHIMPNRLYPLYKLMILYEDIGSSDKCLEITQRIIVFKEKVSSTATKQMKDKANEIIKAHEDNKKNH